MTVSGLATSRILKTVFPSASCGFGSGCECAASKKGNITCAQKAMVHCGIACVNGAWSVHHLSQRQQRVVCDHQSHYLGELALVSNLLGERGTYV